jgi:hypothetical protein
LVLQFLKGALTYLLAFIACMFVVVTALESWPAGMQMLFAFGVPGVVVWWRRSVSEKKIANRPSYHPRQDNAELIKASRDRAERIARELADGVRNLSVTGTSGEALRPQGGGHSALTPYRPNQNNADLIKSSRERAERLAREESKPPVSEAKFSEPRADFFERLKFVRRCQLIGLIKTTRSLFRLGVRLVLRWQKPHSAE